MEPIHDRLETAADSPQAPAELIIQNGRHKGTARPVSQVLTVIGRAAECDLRLNVEGIHPLHCLLAQTPGGLMLRDLSGDGTVTVNGRAVTVSGLQDGDRLAVGPFQFQVRLNQAASAETRDALSQEKKALRVQAAAVAAQQAALIDEELRLQQRQAALQQQEEQLAGHLEEKRKRLLELRDQIKQAHQDLKNHKAKQAALLSEARREVDAERHELAAGKRKVTEERRRLRNLLKRMRQRFHRQWVGERAAIARREAAVARQQQELEELRSRLERDAADVREARLRLNGDIELARRQLKQEWASLREEELHHDEMQARQAAELEALRREIDQRQAALNELEQELEEQRNDWQEVRLEVEKEVEGLDSRARNYRRMIGDLESDLNRLQVTMTGIPATPPAEPAPAAPALPVAKSADPRLVPLERLAGELADQRAHLAEQWQRLLVVQQRWQQHYQSLVRELENAGRVLLERENAVTSRERALATGEDWLRQRKEHAEHLQRQLEAWQARMTARETAWAGERDRLLAEVQSRTRLADKRLAEMRQLQERWTKRRRREVAWLQNERGSSEKARQECASLRDDWLKKAAALLDEQRSLAERSLAMEQYQQEVMGQAANPATAERRLQRIRIRWASHLAESQKEVNAERYKLETAAADLAEQQRQYQKQLTRLTQKEEELADRLRKWESERLRVGDELAQLRQELAVTRIHRDRYEKQVTELRDEVERIARLLIDDAPPPLALPQPEQQPPAQAA